MAVVEWKCYIVFVVLQQSVPVFCFHKYQVKRSKFRNDRTLCFVVRPAVESIVSIAAPLSLLLFLVSMLLLHRTLVAILPVAPLDTNGPTAEPGLVLFPNGLGAVQWLAKTHKSISL